jgi:hypothetical protein
MELRDPVGWRPIRTKGQRSRKRCRGGGIDAAEVEGVVVAIVECVRGWKQVLARMEGLGCDVEK